MAERAKVWRRRGTGLAMLGLLSLIAALGFHKEVSFPVLLAVGPEKLRLWVVEQAEDVGPASLPLLDAALQDSATSVRLKAIKALRSSSEEPCEVTELLARTALRDPNRVARINAVFGLGVSKRCRSIARRALLRVLSEDPETIVRMVAIEEIVAMEGPWPETAIATLLRAVLDEEPEIQGMARNMITELRHQDGILLAIVEALGDDEDKLRRGALKVLESFRRQSLREAAEVLVEALKTEANESARRRRLLRAREVLLEAGVN